MEWGPAGSPVPHGRVMRFTRSSFPCLSLLYFCPFLSSSFWEMRWFLPIPIFFFYIYLATSLGFICSSSIDWDHLFLHLLPVSIYAVESCIFPVIAAVWVPIQRARPTTTKWIHSLRKKSNKRREGKKLPTVLKETRTEGKSLIALCTTFRIGWKSLLNFLGPTRKVAAWCLSSTLFATGSIRSSCRIHFPFLIRFSILIHPRSSVDWLVLHDQPVPGGDSHAVLRDQEARNGADAAGTGALSVDVDAGQHIEQRIGVVLPPDRQVHCPPVAEE